MTTADSAWLHMDDPTNLMMITGVFLFDQPVDFERLRATIECRLLCHRRFTMRVTEPRLGRPCWESDPEFDLNRHLFEARVEAGSDLDSLMEYVSALMSEPLNRRLSPWEMRLVPYGTGSALVCRLHHCIADGIALMRVLLNMTDSSPDAPAPQPVVRPRRARRSSLEMAWEQTVRILGTEVRPAEFVDALGAAADLGKMLLVEVEPSTPFKGKLGIKKLAAVSRNLSLAAVKKASKAAGATVNDLLMAALTGAFRSYLLRSGLELKDTNIRVVVPVDLRQGSVDHLGNRFGMVFLSLPVGLADPGERLKEVKRRMDALKSSPQAAVVLGLLAAVGVVPAEVEKRVVQIFGSKATAVVSNVPGPQQTLYLGGSAIESLMYWVPQSGRLGLGVSIISYDGRVRVGVNSDAALVPDPQNLVRDFEQALQELLQPVSATS